jgi:hypothetical protein
MATRGRGLQIKIRKSFIVTEAVGAKAAAPPTPLLYSSLHILHLTKIPMEPVIYSGHRIPKIEPIEIMELKLK